MVERERNATRELLNELDGIQIQYTLIYRSTANTHANKWSTISSIGFINFDDSLFSRHLERPTIPIPFRITQFINFGFNHSKMPKFDQMSKIKSDLCGVDFVLIWK